MKINSKKIKTVVINNMKVKQKKVREMILEQVNKLKYLRTMIPKDGNLDEELKTRTFAGRLFQ